MNKAIWFQDKNPNRKVLIRAFTLIKELLRINEPHCVIHQMERWATRAVGTSYSSICSRLPPLAHYSQQRCTHAAVRLLLLCANTMAASVWEAKEMHTALNWSCSSSVPNNFGALQAINHCETTVGFCKVTRRYFSAVSLSHCMCEHARTQTNTDYTFRLVA